MTNTDQAALPLWSANEPTEDYTPMFAVGEHVHYVDDDTWRGVVVQVAKYEPTGRNHFWVVWSIGADGGPHEHTAADLQRAPKLPGDKRRNSAVSPANTTAATPSAPTATDRHARPRAPRLTSESGGPHAPTTPRR